MRRSVTAATDPHSLDPVLHQPMRTRIVAAFAQRKEVSFSELKSALAITDGNLDAHLRKLATAGYLHSRFVTTGARPHTLYSLSPSGRKAWRTYARTMRRLLAGSDDQGT